MAFRRSNTDVPQSVGFPSNLTELGFTINPDGQVVEIDEPHRFYYFEKFADHDTNQQYYHALHQAVRERVHEGLAEMGVHPLHVHQGNYKQMYEVGHAKPTSRSVKILATPRISQIKTKEIYVVIGDSKHELAIWSRKTLLTEAGLVHGSAMGLVAQVSGDEKLSNPEVAYCDLPGVVVLNPGELHYSQEAQECMSAVAWQDRKSRDGFADKYQTDEKYNTVPGHESPNRHVETCLDGLFNHVAGSKAKVNIITIGDGSEHVLQFLNKEYQSSADKHLLNLQITIAMIQPTHNANIVTVPALQRLLANRGQIWEADSKLKGTLLRDVAPELKTQISSHPAELDEEGIDTYNFRHDVITLKRAGLTDDKVRVLARPRALSKIKPHVMDSAKLEADRVAAEQGINPSHEFTNWMTDEIRKFLVVGKGMGWVFDWGLPSEDAVGANALATSADSDDIEIDRRARDILGDRRVETGWILDGSKLGSANTAPHAHFSSVGGEQSVNKRTPQGTETGRHLMPITDRHFEDLGSLRLIEDPVLDPNPGDVDDNKIEGAAADSIVGSANDNQTVNAAPDADTASGKDDQTRDSTPDNIFGPVEDIQTQHAAADTKIGSVQDSQTEGAAPDTILGSVDHGHTDDQGILWTRAGPPPNPPGWNENDSYDTPSGEQSRRMLPIDYLRGSGLTMAPSKSAAAVAEAAAAIGATAVDSSTAAAKATAAVAAMVIAQRTAVKDSAATVEPAAVTKSTAMVKYIDMAKHTAMVNRTAVDKPKAHVELQSEEQDPVPMLASPHATSKPIPILTRAKPQVSGIAAALAKLREEKLDIVKEKGKAAATAALTVDDHAFPYHEAPVNCPTYSAGIEDTLEMIFPVVMQDVVKFFHEMN